MPRQNIIANRSITRIATLMLACGFVSLSWVSLVEAQGRGVVEGRLINGTDPKIVGAGVDLDVIQLGAGMSILKSSVTDAAGRFRIEALPTDFPLMIRANYHSANYHGRVNFDASGRASVEIEIFESTTSLKGIRVEGVRIGLQLDGDHLRVLESYSSVNETQPKKTFMSMEGNFRFAKAAGIAEPPRMSVTGPGSAMPLVQSPLESPDGQSYYTLYPIRPGTTVFEIEYVLPYHDRTYTYRRRFYQDIASYRIGVIPRDMQVSAEGLRQIPTEQERNFAVYAGGPLKAGEEVMWTFSGGTPSAVPSASADSGEPSIKPMPTTIGRNTLVLGPLLLMIFMAILWYAYNAVPTNPTKGQDPRTRELKERREKLLNFMATLDNRYESQALDRREYLRHREQAKRQLRTVLMLLGKKS